MAADEIAALLDRGGRVVVRVECPVCAPGEPTRTQDCGACDGSGHADELVPVMIFVGFVLEHVPAGPNATDTFTADGQIDELRKVLRDAIGRASGRSATEATRQDALRTASEASQAILTLRSAVAA
jgi:hypothetical protein